MTNQTFGNKNAKLKTWNKNLVDYFKLQTRQSIRTIDKDLKVHRSRLFEIDPKRLQKLQKKLQGTDPA